MRGSLAEKEEKKAREGRLRLAIENDNVDEVHNLIVEEAELLDRVSKHPFPNTPLHIAAAAGKINVAMEMAILKPSFARKLNPEGFSPMHLALQHGQYPVVWALMTLDPKLVRVRGRGGITSLHFVARENGHDLQEKTELLELLAEFLRACKSSVEVLTSQCETAVHIAVKNHNLDAFKVLLGWLKRVSLKQILNWKDEDGNTVLHIAVRDKQPEIIELLIGETDVNAKNFQDKTALKIFQENPCGDQDLAKKIRRRGRKASALFLWSFLSRELTGIEKYEFFFGYEDETARDIILVVATLIATATYQAALSPPGGYWQDTSSSSNATAATAKSSNTAIENPHEAGDIIMKGSNLYFFSIVNSLAFFASIGTIWATALPLWPRTSMVYIAMVILGTAFSYSLVSQFPKSERFPGLLLGCLYMSLQVAVLVVPLFVWTRYSRVVNRVDVRGRRLENLLGSKGRK